MIPIDLSFIPPLWMSTVLNAVGVYVGIYAITTIQRVKPSLEGSIIGTMTFFQCGMMLMVSSFALTLFFTVLGLIPPAPSNIYQLLMMSGIIAFAFTATKFSNVVWYNLNK